MKKRFWALFLAVMMVVSILPTSVFAEGTPQNLLQPDDLHYNFDGTPANNATTSPDITLSKTAKDKGDGVYEVTLSAAAKDVVQPKPTKVIFVLDASSSMSACTEENCKHDKQTGTGCSVTNNNFSHQKSRWTIATGAIATMKSKLGTNGIEYLHVFFGNNGTPTGTNHDGKTAFGAYPLSGVQYTYISAGVDAAVGLVMNKEGQDYQFKDVDSNYVMIIVSDGAATDKNYNPASLQGFKSKGGKVYAIGFTFSNDSYKGMASTPADYKDAQNASQLTVAMEQISKNIIGLINDPMGSNVELQGTVSVQGYAGSNLVSNKDLINWTNESGLKDPVTLTYTVVIKDTSKVAGDYTYDLNGDAKLNYSYNGVNKSIAFPVPKAVISAATLDVNYKLGNQVLRNDHEWIKLPDTFDATLPSVGTEIEIDGVSYWVTAVSGEVPTNPASIAYNVTVDLSTTPPAPTVYTLSYNNTASVKPATATIPAPVTDIEKNGSVDPLTPATTTEASKDGIPGAWTFDGWYLSEDLSGSAVTSVSNITADVNVYAKWSFTPGTYTLTYNNTAEVKPATATIPEAVTGIEYNGSVAALTPATTTETSLDGVPGAWTFDGWYLSEDLSGSAVTSVSNITANVNVYAKWTFDATTYTVTYDLNGGTSTSEQLVYPELPYGAETPTIDNPTKESDAVNTYTFLSWSPSFEDTVTADVTYVAQWSTIPREAKLSVISKVLKFEDIGNEEGDIMPEMPRAIALTEYNVGDTLTWTITVMNNGNLDAQLTADMIADTIYYGDTAEGPWTALTGASVTFPETLPVVMAGETASIDVTWVITEAVAGKYIKNAAKINLEGEEEQEALPVYVTPAPSVSVSKTADKRGAYVGDKITYTVTVFNDGNVDLKNVTLADSFGSSIANVKVPAGVTYSNGVFTIASLAKNETVTVTYDYTALNAGKLSNTIVATIKVGNEDKVADTDSVVVEIVVYDPVKPNLPDRPMLNREDHYAYIVGYPDGLVHPEKNITRAEVSTIFFRMLLDESREDFWAQENWFSDVPSHMWFNNAVSTLANAGLITGYPDGSFKPNANITRAEFATIAIRFFLEEDVEITENNLSDIKGHWAEANINLAYALNLINGYPDGTFRPNQLITRAEAMTIVNRVLERAPHKDHLLENMIEWPDNMNKDAWYYADVQEATNSHEFHRATENDQKIFEVWTELLPVRDWVALEQMWSQANSSKNPGEIVDFNITTP